MAGPLQPPLNLAEFGAPDYQACGEKFETPGRLELHVRLVHTGGKVYTCEYCGKHILQSSNYRTHLKVHINAKTGAFKCSFCKTSNGYVNAQTLKEHMVKIHGVYRRAAGGGVTDGDLSSTETGKNSPVPPSGKTQSTDAGA